MDLTETFRLVVSLSLLGSLLTTGLFLIKLLFRPKLSASWHYYIWFVLLLRLLIPFTPSASFSVLNLIPYHQQAIDLLQVSNPGSEGRAPTVITNTGENSSNVTPGNLSGNENAEPPAAAIAQPPAVVDPQHPQHPWASSLKTLFNWQTSAFIWVIGVLAISLYILFVNGLLVCKIRKHPVCDSEEILRILEECKLKLNVQAKVSVVYDDALKSPALFGLFSPRIIISPEVVNRLSPDELRYVFLHELSHLKRHDLLVNGLVLAVQVIYWFNPLIWYALRQMKQDCEIACDATALAALKPEDHKKYGQTIISLLQMLSEPHWAPGTLGFVGKFNTRRIVMISTYKKTTIKWAVAALALVLVVGCSSLNNPINPGNTSQNEKPAASGGQQKDTGSQQSDQGTNGQQKDDQGTPASPASPGDAKSIVYQNARYGFNFTLPKSWKGYSVVTGTWDGNDVKSGKKTETGPLISIRHPLWTSKNPRQDIPIQVFSLNQWNALQQEKFHIGAAPIGPSELGRNSSYVFALPARYNFAFPTGYEEVEKILANHPLQAAQTKPLKVAADYFPLVAGSSWQYKGEGNEYASYVTKVLYTKGNRAQISEANGGTVSASVFELSNDTVKKVFFQGEEYEGTNYLNKQPNQNSVILQGPIQVGTKWQYLNGTREIVDINAAVQTPAGKFENCIKVKIDEPDSTMYEYYKEGIGLVKKEFISGDTKVTSVLEKYSIK